MAFPRLVRPAFFLAGALAAAALSGCGRPTADVSGTITLYGQPPNGKGIQITFIAPDGRMASAPVAEDGSYKAEKAPVGELGVGFAYTPPAGGRFGKTGPKIPTSKENADIEPQGQQAPNPIPFALRDPSTSKVNCKVEAGKKNVFNYDIRP